MKITFLIIFFIACILVRTSQPKPVYQQSLSDLLNQESNEISKMQRHEDVSKDIEQQRIYNGNESELGSFIDESEMILLEDASTGEFGEKMKLFNQESSRNREVFTQIKTKTQMTSQTSPSMDVTTLNSDSSSPLDNSNSSASNQIEDPSDEQLAKMEIYNPTQKSSGETEERMPTQTATQTLGNGVEGPASEITETEQNISEPEETKPIPNTNCGTSSDIMNCDMSKNQIRIENVNEKAIEKQIEKNPSYEIAFYYGIVLSILILIVLLLSNFRQSLSKYLSKYYLKSLRIIILDIIILISLNAIVQLLYYNRYFDVIQLDYFNIYGFTITFSFFSIFWIFIATAYAFILQIFDNTYRKFEGNWKKRFDFLDVETEEETNKEFEERVSNIQYFLIKEDFVMPVSMIAYTEPMVLRQDFDFAEYLGRAQAKCHLQLFNITISTLLILIVFFTIVCLIDLISNWKIECLIILTLPIVSFIICWIANKKQLEIIQKLTSLVVHSQEIESLKFLNLDLRKPVQFANKLSYPSYLTKNHVYTEPGVSKHVSLFPFSAVSFPLKLVHFALVLQIVWIMVFLFNYSQYLGESWECQIIFSIGLFIIIFQLFFVIPFFLKKYAINTHIQQLKDYRIIDRVVYMHKQRVTLAFQKFYRLLKHLTRNNKSINKSQLKLRPEIMNQLKEISDLKISSLDELARKLGLQGIQYDELYYLGKAFSDIRVSLEIEALQNEEFKQNRKLAALRVPQNKSDHSNNSDKQLPDAPAVSAQFINNNDNQKNQEKGDLDSSLIDILPPVLQLRGGAGKTEQAINIHQSQESEHDAAGQSSEDISLLKPKGSSKDQKIDSQKEKGTDNIIATQKVFELQDLHKVCSIFTQEVVQDPYVSSRSSLQQLFDQRELISLDEFERVIKSYYAKIEPEKMNLIIDIADIQIIVNEVFYLQDKNNKVSIQRIASLIRNSIEMLPR